MSFLTLWSQFEHNLAETIHRQILYRILMKMTSWCWTLEMRSMFGLETSLHQKKGSWAQRWLRYASTNQVQVFWQWLIILNLPSVWGYTLLQELHAPTHPGDWLSLHWFLAYLLSWRKKIQAAILTYCILPSTPCNAASLCLWFFTCSAPGCVSECMHVHR